MPPGRAAARGRAARRAEPRGTQHKPGWALSCRHGGVAGPDRPHRAVAPPPPPKIAACARSAQKSLLRASGSIRWIPLSPTAKKVGLLPAYVSRHAHDDACACTCPVVTGEVVSLLLGYERPRGAVTAPFAVVQGVLRWEFLTAGAVVEVAVPPSVRSFHLRLVAVAAVALHRAICCQVVRVPVQDMPSVGVLYGNSFVVFERPVMSVLVSPGSVGDDFTPSAGSVYMGQCVAGDCGRV